MVSLHVARSESKLNRTYTRTSIIDYFSQNVSSRTMCKDTNCIYIKCVITSRSIFKSHIYTQSEQKYFIFVLIYSTYHSLKVSACV